MKEEQGFLQVAKTPLARQEWSAWSLWSPCSQSCGAGFATRSRQCIVKPPSSHNPSICPSHQGASGVCPGLSEARRACQEAACPPWGSWNNWSPCSATCGQGGRQRRARRCLRPAACTGAPVEDRICIGEPAVDQLYKVTGSLISNMPRFS